MSKNLIKQSKLIGVVFWLTIAVLLLTVTARAQSGVRVTPNELTVTATRSGGAMVTRTLLFQSTAPITAFQIIFLDLTRVDNQVVLPAANIQMGQSALSFEAGASVTIPITFDLRAVSSGEYRGSLLVSYEGGSLTIPVAVLVKDAPFWPLVVLFLGVGLGLVVSGYRTQGKPRDEVLVSMGQVRTEMQADSELVASFKSAISAQLLEAESALQAKKWAAAQANVEQAQAIWLNWRKQRQDWLKQISFANELLSSDDLQAENSRCLKTLARNLNEAIQDAPNLPGGPRDLNQSLNITTYQLSRYLEFRSRIEKLNQFEQLTPVQQRTLADFQEQLNAMLPDDDDKYADLHTAVAEMQQSLVAAQTLETAALSSRHIDNLPHNLPLPAPSLRPSEQRPVTEEQKEAAPGCLTSFLRPLIQPLQSASGQQSTVSKARRRLQWFAWGGYLLAIILLVGAGFSQLYITRPTFGATLWSDYFALFLWGFGAEASRAAITDVLRSLDLPEMK